MHTTHTRRQGFTLIEVMISMVIIAILASIALPSYKQHVIKGKRAAAKAEMMDIANREEQFLLANRAYATKDTLVTNGYALKADIAKNYDWTVETNAAGTTLPTYLITFTGKGGQLSDGVLTLNSAGAKTPAAKW